MKKLGDTIIYSHEDYYSSFPSVVSRPDGELLVAFRRAPNRRKYFAPGYSHTDPNSYLVMVRSRDLGRSWSREPELIYAHPLGGSQDPCMVQLDDGALVVSSYAWMLLPGQAVEHADRNSMVYECWPFVSLGGYLLRSTDNGRTWDGPIIPPEFEDQDRWLAQAPKPALNRGAMTQGSDGKLYWAVVRTPKTHPKNTVLELLVSADGGLSWEHLSHIVSDDKVVFNETSLLETAGGDLVGFVRTSNFDDHGVMIRSKDRGKSWEPWKDMGVVGHPYHAIRLPDERVYILYGYRHKPYGIRARVYNPECTRFESDEIVLRDDGGSSDIGYPWSCLTADGRVLSTYYLNIEDGTRHIAGTFLEIT